MKSPATIAIRIRSFIGAAPFVFLTIHQFAFLGLVDIVLLFNILYWFNSVILISLSDFRRFLFLVLRRKNFHKASRPLNLNPCFDGLSFIQHTRTARNTRRKFQRKRDENEKCKRTTMDQYISIDFGQSRTITWQYPRTY